MKVTSNQILRNRLNPCFSALIGAYQSAIVSPAIKIYLVIKALNVFFVEVGINWKKVLQVLLIGLFFAISAVVFFKLFIRALDIEANAQEMVLAQYQEELSKPYPSEGQ